MKQLNRIAVVGVVGVALASIVLVGVAVAAVALAGVAIVGLVGVALARIVFAGVAVAGVIGVALAHIVFAEVAAAGVALAGVQKFASWMATAWAAGTGFHGGRRSDGTPNAGDRAIKHLKPAPKLAGWMALADMRHLNRTPKLAGWMALALVLILVSTGGARPDGSTPVQAAALDSALPAETVLITVREITNRVDSQRPRGQDAAATEFVAAVVGQDLLPGDGIKTFQNSEARVDIEVGDFTRISRTTPNTLWRLGQFAVEGRTIIELDQGKIFLFDDDPGKEGWPVDVVTPTGRASPRGTWMSVEYDPDTGVTEVQCFRGSCQLQNPIGTVMLGAEQKSAVSATTAPSMPEVLAVADKRGFTKLPEAVSGEVPVPPALSGEVAASPPTLEELPAASRAMAPLDPFTQGEGDPIARFSNRELERGGESGAPTNAGAKPDDNPGNDGQSAVASVGRGKLEDGSGNNGQGVNASVDRGKPEDGSVNNGQGVNASVDRGKPEDGSVNNGKGVNPSVDNGKPEDGSRGRSDRLPSSVDRGQPDDDGSRGKGSGVSASADKGNPIDGSRGKGSGVSASADKAKPNDGSGSNPKSANGSVGKGKSENRSENGKGFGAIRDDDDPGSGSTDSSGSGSTDSAGSGSSDSSNGGSSDSKDKDKDKDSGSGGSSDSSSGGSSDSSSSTDKDKDSGSGGSSDSSRGGSSDSSSGGTDDKDKKVKNK